MEILEKIIWEAANVAWPQRGASSSGENHRIRYLPSAISEIYAVSDQPKYAATFCILELILDTSFTQQTPAGLPVNGLPVNASTRKNIKLLYMTISCIVQTLKEMYKHV
jgi:hypothetical protein